jgi:capsule polysaccharide export protein KpsE/RkpR
MARTTTTIVCLQARKEAMRKETMMENRESISSGEEVNSMKIKAQEE